MCNSCTSWYLCYYTNVTCITICVLQLLRFMYIKCLNKVNGSHVDVDSTSKSTLEETRWFILAIFASVQTVSY